MPSGGKGYIAMTKKNNNIILNPIIYDMDGQAILIKKPKEKTKDSKKK